MGYHVHTAMLELCDSMELILPKREYPLKHKFRKNKGEQNVNSETPGLNTQPMAEPVSVPENTEPEKNEETSEQAETVTEGTEEKTPEVMPEAEVDSEPEAEVIEESEADPEPEPEPLVRAKPDIDNGLTQEQVQNRIANGAVNKQTDEEELTMKKIIRENVFTYFNLIFVIIAGFLFAVGAYKEMTFLPLILFNTLIGILQEWRSKATLDKLNIMNAPKSIVVRGGIRQEIASADLVVDDLTLFSAGRQIPADGIVLDGEVNVNESLLTGEAEEIVKKPGDRLLSGSFVVSGNCKAQIDRVGADAYASVLMKEAKARKKGEQSEMIRSLDRLLIFIGILIIPISVALFIQQYHYNGESLRDSVTATAAAVIGMIPEGLYLLSSVAMAVSAMRLALGKVLVHNMKSIETLARADVLCVDKTGTITEGSMTVDRLIVLPKPHEQITGPGEDDPIREEAAYASDDSPRSEEGPREPEVSQEEQTEVELMIGDFAAAQAGDNATMKALKTRFTRQTGRRPDRIFGFSSVYKYSAAIFKNRNLILGAPEFLLRSSYEDYRERIEKYSILGYRVLIFGEYMGQLDGGQLIDTVNPLAMVLLTNPVREKAPETFRYFAEQGVGIKVISGDNPMTVSEVAMKAGIQNAELYVDASGLDDADLAAAADRFTVFGRVNPQQKRILVQALKKAGHTVAMTGDGVNDVLALREADCSIAMASGAEAAASAAQMVLLESDFAKMPAIVGEGRRVVNNIERTASLFLVKNIFSLLMSLFSIFFAFNYPLQPMQISLISAFTIGAPAFFMSLEPNKGTLKGRFMSNVLYKALPAGLTDFLVISVLVIFCQEFNVSSTDLATSCTILLQIVGLMILYKISQPMTKFHWVIWFAMLFGLLFCMLFLNGIFEIHMISKRCAMILLLFAVATEPCLRYLSILVKQIWRACSWLKAQVLEQIAKTAI